MGIDTTGAMQDFWVVPSTTLFPLPDTVSLKHGAMIEPLAVAAHSVRRSGLNEGDRALIAGAGPIGTLIALVAKTLGAKVMVSEPSPQRRSNAEAIGLETIDPLGQQFDAVIAEWSDGEGVDVGFEAAASPSATESMIASLAARGRLVPVGIHSGPVPVDLFRVFWRELEIIGSRLYGPVDYRRAIELADRDEIPFERLITDVVGIDEIERAFSDLESGRATKVLVEFGGNELG